MKIKKINEKKQQGLAAIKSWVRVPVIRHFLVSSHAGHVAVNAAGMSDVAHCHAMSKGRSVSMKFIQTTLMLLTIPRNIMFLCTV